MKNNNVLNVSGLHNPDIVSEKCKNSGLCFFLIEKDSENVILEFKDCKSTIEFIKDNPKVDKSCFILVVSFDSHIGVKWFVSDFAIRVCDIAEETRFSSSPINIFSFE